MFKPKESSQVEYEFISIVELVPDDHLLRLIDKYIDFSFLLVKVRPFYSDDNGRPTDPLNLLKMMFIGYLYGIRSERQIDREIKTNVAYRWFLGLRFKDPVPHHSTISWNRQHRFKDTIIFQKNASEQSLLTAACQNIKKIATHLARLEKVCCNSLG